MLEKSGLRGHRDKTSTVSIMHYHQGLLRIEKRIGLDLQQKGDS